MSWLAMDKSGCGLVGLFDGRQRREYCLVAGIALPFRARPRPGGEPAHYADRAALPAERCLCARLRLPLHPAARRRAAHLPVRYLALQRDGRPFRRDRGRAKLRRAMGHRARALGKVANSDTAKNIAKAIVPTIVVAEICSWYAVITTNFLGNVLENSLWTITFLIIGIALSRLVPRFRGPAQFAIAAAAAGIAAYVVFMSTVDVPMYFGRWQADLASGKDYLGLFAGLHDVATRWIVTHDIAPWRDEIAWMSLYFSTAVWGSLALAGFGLVKHLLPRYSVREPITRATRRPVAVRVRSS